MELQKRKHPRLNNYDYSQNGCYFVTICIKDRAPLLGQIHVGRDALIPPIVELLNVGKVADQFIQNINITYSTVQVDHYIIMPNHIHLLISIHEQSDVNGGMRASRPTLHTIIRSFKTMVTKQLGYSVWQDSYYDRIIRNEKEYQAAWLYIDENPIKWQEDELFCEPCSL